MKKITLFLICILMLTCAEAQSSRREKLRTFGGWAGAGGVYPNLTSLNSALSAAKLIPIPQKGFTNINVGVIGINNRFVYGADLTYLTKLTSVTTVNIPSFAYVRYATLMPRVGIVAFKMENFYLYPSVGFGGGRTTLKAIDTLSADVYTYRTYGLITDGAINGNFIIPMRNGVDENAIIGFMLGYQYTPMVGNSWKLNNWAQDPKPSVSPQSLYFRISFGMTFGRD